MIKVTNDLFDIANRLILLDPTYEVFLNTQKNRFQVHKQGKLSFTVTADILDERVLWSAMQAGINVDCDQMSQHNLQVQNSAQEKMDQAIRDLQEMFQFANQTSQDVTFGKTRRQI